MTKKSTTNLYNVTYSVAGAAPATEVGVTAFSGNRARDAKRKEYRLAEAAIIVAAAVNAVNGSAFTTAFAVDNFLVPAEANIISAAKVTFTSTGTLPAPLVAVTEYWVLAGAGKFRVSLTNAGAEVALTTNGTGTHSVFIVGVGAAIVNLNLVPAIKVLGVTAQAPE